MKEWFAIIMGASLLVLMIPILYRIIVGPTGFDRILGVNVIGTKTAVILVIIGTLFDRVDMFVDFAIAYALLNFVGRLWYPDTSTGPYPCRRWKIASQDRKGGRKHDRGSCFCSNPRVRQQSGVVSRSFDWNGDGHSGSCFLFGHCRGNGQVSRFLHPYACCREGGHPIHYADAHRVWLGNHGGLLHHQLVIIS